MRASASASASEASCASVGTSAMPWAAVSETHPRGWPARDGRWPRAPLCPPGTASPSDPSLQHVGQRVENAVGRAVPVADTDGPGAHLGDHALDPSHTLRHSRTSAPVSSATIWARSATRRRAPTARSHRRSHTRGSLARAPVGASAPSPARRRSSCGPLAGPRHRAAHVPGDLDAAPVTDLAVHECLADRLAEPGRGPPACAPRRLRSGRRPAWPRRPGCGRGARAARSRRVRPD
jgi:hypothetical protein